MSNVVCSKCGLEASSKCPVLRSIFTDTPEGLRDSEFLMGHIGTFKEVSETRDSGSVKKYVTITFRSFDGEDYNTLLERLQRMLKDISPEHLKILACVHTFVHKPGTDTCMFCGQENVEGDR